MMTGADEKIRMTSYSQRIEQIRSKQLPNWQDSLYLDASASAPVARCVLDAVHSRLIDSDRPISNPHSNSPSGRRTRQEIDDVRTLLCKEIFQVQRKAGIIVDGKGVDAGWEICFNSGTTAGLQMVARSFNFGRSGTFAYLRQSHSSLYGLRDIVQDERKEGAFEVNVLEEEDLERWISNTYMQDEGYSILALPLQCNATGKRFQRVLTRILKLRESLEAETGIRRAYILLDAASYLSPSLRMDLSQDCIHQPDFICFSMIKLLGYPSGLGGLLIQRFSALALSDKKYFGGGTLDATTSKMQWRQPKKEVHESFEDGTLNLFGILSIPPALKAIRSEEMLGTWEEANDYVNQLTKYLWTSLHSLEHGDGSAMCEIYSSKPEEWDTDGSNPSNGSSQGPCILFNVLKAAEMKEDAYRNDLRIDPVEVDRLACLDDIHIRSGRMCNVGAITTVLDLEEEDIVNLWKQGIGCGGSIQSNDGASLRFENPKEYARLSALVHGALRVSLSAWNTFSDVDRFVKFLEKYFYSNLEADKVDDDDEFVECTSSSSEDEDEEILLKKGKTSSCGTSIDDHDENYYLDKVYIYPIKSCAAQRIYGEWKLSDTGLEYDRDFCLVDLVSGNVLSQKRFPAMARIRSTVCLEEGELRIEFYDVTGEKVENALSIPLEHKDGSGEKGQSERQYELCGTSCKPLLINDSIVQEAFSQFLGIECTLARSPSGHRTMEGVPLKLSNESPFLLISSESISQVCQWMKDEDEDHEFDHERVGMAFRANFVISGNHVEREEDLPFYEDSITKLRIGNYPFTILGPCRRCEMIALDPKNGKKTPKVMTAIAKHRRCQIAGPMRGKLLFGQHLVRRQTAEVSQQDAFIKAGMLLKLEHD